MKERHQNNNYPNLKVVQTVQHSVSQYIYWFSCRS